MKLYTILGVIVFALALVGCMTATQTDNVTDNTTGNITDEQNQSSIFDSGLQGSSNVTQNVTSPTTDTSSTTRPNRAGIDATFVEGDVVQIRRDAAVDPDGGELRYTYSAPLNAQGRWETRVGDAGIYELTITASDGRLISTRTVVVEVLPLNLPPVIENFVDITVNEGETIRLNPTVTDPDGDDVTLTYSGFMTSDTRQTSYDDAGVYEVTLTADDGTAQTTQTITVTVLNVNRAPVITQLQATDVVEGELAIVSIVAEDPDGDQLTYTYGEPFNAEGTWRTSVGDAGDYSIPVTVSDGEDSVTQTVSFTVTPANNPPVIENFGDITVNEGETIVFNPTVTDPDGDEVSYFYSGYMTSNTRETTYGDAGEYRVTLTATDGVASTTQTVSVTVIKVNRPPVFQDDLFE